MHVDPELVSGIFGVISMVIAGLVAVVHKSMHDRITKLERDHESDIKAIRDDVSEKHHRVRNAIEGLHEHDKRLSEAWIAHTSADSTNRVQSLIGLQDIMQAAERERMIREAEANNDSHPL